MKETKFLRKIFGTVNIRAFVLVLMVMSLIFVTLGISLALNVLFEFYADEIAQEGLEFARAEGISQEIYDIVIDYADMIIHEIRWYIIGFVVITTVLINVFIDWVNRRLVKVPVERIGEKALQIAENRKNLGDQLEPPLFSELESMTEAFNTMSTALREQMDELEERVEERTAELEQARDKMEYMAMHDALTGLPNRWLFDEHFEQALRVAQRGQKELTLLMIDLDNYKAINDTHGHLIGDSVIKAVGERMADTLRGSDLVSRWGGDEFAILLYEVSQKDSVQKVVEKVFKAFKDPIEVKDNSFVIQMSVGAARYPQDGEDMVALLKHADAALYGAKEHRERNSLRFYSKEDIDVE